MAAIWKILQLFRVDVTRTTQQHEKMPADTVLNDAYIQTATARTGRGRKKKKTPERLAGNSTMLQSLPVKK